MPSYQKRGNTWSCRFSLTINGKPKQVRLSNHYKTKKECVAAYEQFLLHQDEVRKKMEQECIEQEQLKKNPDDMFFVELFNKHQDWYKTRVRDSTFYTQSRKAITMILPYFDTKKIKDITASDILKWQMSISDYSYPYQKDLTTMLRAIFKFGNDFYGTKQFTIKAPRSKGSTKEMQIWTPKQYQCFHECLIDDKEKMFFDILFYGGLRKGEALALKWKDIKSDYIDINKSLDMHKQPYQITPPKNESSKRKVSMPSDMIQQWNLMREKDDDFIFGYAHTTLDRIFNRAKDKSEMPDIRIHDLRHSHASYLIHKGISIVAVSKRLGHSDVNTTLSVYSHMMPIDNTLILNAIKEI